MDRKAIFYTLLVCAVLTSISQVDCITCARMVNSYLPSLPEDVCKFICDRGFQMGLSFASLTKDKLVEFVQVQWQAFAPVLKKLLNKDASTLNDEEKKQLSEFIQMLRNQEIIGDVYDLVVNATSLKAISRGWEVNCTNDVLLSAFQGRSIGFIGSYDVGKTYIIDLATGRKYPVGISKTTLGISVALHEDQLFLDCEGSKRAARYHIEDRLATDAFLQQMMIHLSDVVVYVVGPLQTIDVPNINSVYQEVLKLSKAENVKKLVLVHNFKDYTEIAEVERHIEDDIISPFKGVQSLGKGCKQKKYISHNGKVEHIIFAHAGSRAGDEYNKCGGELLRNMINGLGGFRDINIMKEIAKVAENLLPKYFFVPGTDPTAIPEVFNREIDSISRSGHPSTEFTSFKERMKQLWQVTSGSIGSIPFFNKKNEKDATDVYEVEDPFGVVENRDSIKLKHSVGELHYLPFYGSLKPDAAFDPTYDLYVSDDRWLLHADIPGTSSYGIDCKDAITMIFHGYRPSTNTTGKPPKQDKRIDTQRVRKYGSFAIKFTLPEWATCQSIKKVGQLKDGVYIIDYHKPTPSIKDEL